MNARTSMAGRIVTLFLQGNIAISATMVLFPALIVAGLWTGQQLRGAGLEARGGLQARSEVLASVEPNG